MPEKFLKNIKPREYQKKIFEICKNKNCLVVLPTGLGKTLIALMLSIQRMTKYPGEKVIFLAPTRPLAEQHLKSFEKNLPELFGEMQLFTGKVNASERKKIWQTADIIFSTPQCVGNDLKKGLYTLEDVCLLIEDECHRCLKNYDYNFIAQKYKQQSQHQRIMGLTASPGSEESKIKEICKNLSIEAVELRTRESEDVKEYLQDLEFKKIFVDFPPEFEELRQVIKKIYNSYIQELKMRNLLFGPPTKFNLIKLQKKLGLSISKGNRNFNMMLGISSCAQAIKIQHALELLETQTLESFKKYLDTLKKEAERAKSKGVQKLVSKKEFKYIHQRTEELLKNNIEHPKISKVIEIIENEKKENEKIKIILFTQFRETAYKISKNINKIPNIKSKIFVGQAKKSETGLSQKEQKKIIEEFSQGEINVLCATCIAEEGLDIPEVNAVIFYEPIPSAIRTIQRTGRTARLKEGKLIILITKGTRDETFYYVSRSRQKGMYKAIDSIKEKISKGISDFKEEQKTLE